MKFSCDSCGAQYTIDDEKLGTRGVKVRCKKCSFVIVLRPPGYQARSRPPPPPEVPVVRVPDSSPGFAPFGSEDRTHERVLPRGVVEDGEEDTLMAPLSTQDVAPLDAAGGIRNDPNWALAVEGFGHAAPARDPASTVSPFEGGRAGGSLADLSHRDDRAGLDSVADDLSAPVRGLVSPVASKSSRDLLGRGAEDADEDIDVSTAVGDNPLAYASIGSSDRAVDETDISRGAGALWTIAGSADGPSADASTERRAFGGARGSAVVSRAFLEDVPSEGGDPARRTRDADLGPAHGLLTPEASSPAARDHRDDHIDERAERKDGHMVSPNGGLSFGDDRAPLPRGHGNGRIAEDGSSHESFGEDRTEALDGFAERVAASTMDSDEMSSEDAERSSRLPDVHTESGRRSDVGASGGGMPGAALETEVNQKHGASAHELAERAVLAASATTDDKASAPIAGKGGAALSTLGGESARMNQELSKALDAMFGPMSKEAVDLIPSLSSKTVTDFASPQSSRAGSKADLESLESPAFDFGALRASGRPAKPVAEWYVAIADEQVGPLDVDEVRARFEKGDLVPNSLCWKQGMVDWIAVRFVDEFKDLVIGEDERVRTVVTAVREEKHTDDESLSEPPRIGPPVSTSEDAHIDGRASEEPSWRPSAARALASLAAEEISTSPAPPPPSTGDIPPAHDALEKLLARTDGAAAKAEGAALMFGAMEKSSSHVRPLPRAAEAVTSLPLRDPFLRGRRGLGSQGLIAGAILGAAVLIGAVVIAVTRTSGEAPTKALAESARAALSAPTGPGVVAGGPSSDPVRHRSASGGPESDPSAKATPSAASAAAPSDALSPSPSTEGTGAREAVEGRAADTEARADSEPSAASPEEAGSPSREPSPDVRSTPRRSTKRESSDRRTRGQTKSRAKRSSDQDRGTVVAASKKEAAPAPQPRTGGNEEDELLGAARSSRGEPASDLPHQLDDSDVLGGIRKYKKDVAECLKKQAASDPTVEGRMIVKMVIERSGQPTRVSVQPEKFANSAVGRCMEKSVVRWRFPRFSGPSMPVDFPVLVRGQ